MMRKCVSLILALLLCMSLALSVSATLPGEDQTDVLYDEADLLTVAEENSLRARLREIGSTYSTQIVVITVPFSEEDVSSYAEYLYDAMGFGYGQNRDGVLLLVSMDLRELRIFSNGTAAKAISMVTIDRIGDAIAPDLTDGNYADAFEEFADQCAYYLDGLVNGFPFNAGKKLIIALIVGVLAGLVVSLILKAQLKSVRKQERADVYVKQGSMELTTRLDLFLYRSVKKTRKASGSSSGSGGSSRNVGGRSF